MAVVTGLERIRGARLVGVRIGHRDRGGIGDTGQHSIADDQLGEILTGHIGDEFRLWLVRALHCDWRASRLQRQRPLKTQHIVVRITGTRDPSNVTVSPISAT